MTVNTQRFSLTISLNVLEHLGINLYSNVPAVLSESVANAWDADAENVFVIWNRDADKIEIVDDGTGMTAEDVNKRFLTVGYRRRDEQPGETLKHRQPMGRKGIGKLSLFSIAGCIEVETIKNGEKSAFRMRLDDIRQKIESEGGEGTYNPESLPVENIDFEHGTRIILTELRKRQTTQTTQALKRRLARRFSIIGASQNFCVFVDGSEVLASDRDYYDKIQYLWTFGPQEEVIALCENAQQFDRTNAIVASDAKITGWLGTVREVKHLKDDEGENLNRIAIFVRGKMAHENLLASYSERGVYASYLIGEIRYDDLDTYNGLGTIKDEDSATSSRQQLVEDDSRYVSLKEVLSGELKHIQSEWSKLRAEEGADKATEIPAVKEWIEALQPQTRLKARKWLGKINRIRLDDTNEQKQLIKHAVLAFEFYRAKENLEMLENINDDNFQTALEIFHELDNLEANLYGQIVQQRLEVIKALEEKVDDNALEKAIQKFLFNHLWLLDPAWERAEGSEVMERPVTAMFEEIDAGLSDEEKAGRLDIAYRKSAGQHLIIELKRPERTMSTPELTLQVNKYLSGMQKILQQQNAPHEPVQLIVLLGKNPSDWSTTAGENRSKEALKAYSTRVVFYEQLLRDARQTYQDYIKKRDVVDKLNQIIQAIDDYAPTEAS